jgi:hypothetical protein
MVCGPIVFFSSSSHRAVRWGRVVDPTPSFDEIFVAEFTALGSP